MFALAHAVHELIEVQGRSDIVGSELLSTLIKEVQFNGVTGLVDFFDASSDPDMQFNGDRRSGLLRARWTHCRWI